MVTIVTELVALHALNVEKQVVLHPCEEYAVLPPVAVIVPEHMALQSLAVRKAVQEEDDEDEEDVRIDDALD